MKRMDTMVAMVGLGTGRCRLDAPCAGVPLAGSSVALAKRRGLRGHGLWHRPAFTALRRRLDSTANLTGRRVAQPIASVQHFVMPATRPNSRWAYWVYAERSLER